MITVHFMQKMRGVLHPIPSLLIASGRRNCNEQRLDTSSWIARFAHTCKTKKARGFELLQFSFDLEKPERRLIIAG